MGLPGSGGTVSFKYDPLGRRIYKSSLGGTTIFAYDGDNLIEEASVSGGVVARYSQGPRLDEPLAMLRGGAIGYYHSDGLGSITSLSDSTGATTASYTFDAFGNLTAFTGTLTNPFGYTARELDTETGLYYYRARYYDPFIGRFSSEDPGRFPGGIDFYTYVENDPVGLIDPFGFCPWQVHSRRMKGFPLLPHYYFYNRQTGQSIGLGPASATLKGPTPGNWERGEKPGHNNGDVPDWACNCVDKKAKNPGNPPSFCTFNGKPKAGSPAPCLNCMGWVNTVLQDCYNQAFSGQQ